MGGRWEWDGARLCEVVEILGPRLAGRVALQAGLEGIQAALQCKHQQCWGNTSTTEGSDCEELGRAVAQGTQCGLLWLSWVELS